MRPAPPAVATLARLAAEMHRARRAPACARVPPRCAHTRAQVATVIKVLNIHMAHNPRKLAMVLWLHFGQHSERCWAAAGTKDALHVYQPEIGRAAPIVDSLEHPPESRAPLTHQISHNGFCSACECACNRTQ